MPRRRSRRGVTDGRAGNILAVLEDKPASGAANTGWVCSACHTAQASWALPARTAIGRAVSNRVPGRRLADR